MNQDVTSYKHIITSAFQHEALPFKGYPFPHEFPGGFVLIERKSHTALYDRIAATAEKYTRDEALHFNESTSSIVVIGPFDTGNSSSLNHVFLRCAAMKEVSEGSGKRRKPVIVCDRTVYGEGYRYLIFSPGPDPKVEVSSAEPAALNDHRTVYLYNPPEYPVADKRARAFTVIASSPNRATYKVVGEAAARFYAYRWEPEEVKEAEKALGSQANPTAVEHCGFRFSFLTGGKLVEDNMERDIHVALRRVDDYSTLSKMVNAISDREGDLLTWSNRLFTMIPPEDDAKMFRDFIVWPVSEYVSDQIHLRLTPMQVTLYYWSIYQ